MKQDERPNKAWMKMSLWRIRREGAVLAMKGQAAELTSEERMTLELLQKIASYRLERFSMLANCVSSGLALQIDFAVLAATSENITASVYRQRCALTAFFLVSLIVLGIILGNILAQNWLDRERLELPVLGLDGEPMVISLEPNELGHLALNISKVLFLVAVVVMLASDWRTTMVFAFVVIILEVTTTALFAMAARRTKLLALKVLQEIEVGNGT